MSLEGKQLPTMVGYRTHVLPDDAVQLDLQVAVTPQNEQDLRRISLAMHRNDAKELGEALLATVQLLDGGPRPLQ